MPNLRTIAYCEREAFPISILLRRIEEGQLDVGPIHTDLKTFPWAEFRDRVSILSGGYPCQPFSAAGNRLGKDDPRHLWPWIKEGITIMQPKQCFFENVDGHVSMGLSTVISDLEEIGYKATWGIFSASEVLDCEGRNAPHQRKRVFILADRIDEGSQGRLRGWASSGWEDLDGHLGRSGASLLGRWPSRPGERQYAWEPPRVVENTKLVGRGGGHHGDAPRDGGEVQVEGSRSCEVGDSVGIRLEPTGDQGAVGEEGGDSGREGSQPSSAFEVTSHSGGEHLGYPERGGLQGWDGDGSKAEELGAGRDQQHGQLGNPQHAGSHGSALSRSVTPSSDDHAGGENSASQSEGASRSGLSGDLRDQNGFAQAEDHPQIEPSFCGDFDGPADRVGYAELCKTYINRTHELRALGNGVVWQQAELAYRVLTEQLIQNS